MTNVVQFKKIVNIKNWYFVILKKYTERITIAVLLWQQSMEGLHVIPNI